MKSEFEILKNIENNKIITQRDLSKKTGMSLGNVNVVIKRLAKKGVAKNRMFITKDDTVYAYT